METVTSPPTSSASVASATAAKKAPGSSVSVASEVVGIYIFVGLIVATPLGPLCFSAGMWPLAFTCKQAKHLN